MGRTRSISSIDTEIKKVEDELIKVQQKQEALEARLLELQKAKHEIEARQIMDAFHNSGKSLRELMIFLDVRRHIVGGANRTLFSVDLPPRLCRTGT